MAAQTKSSEFTPGALSETLAAKTTSKRKSEKKNDKTAKKLKQLFDSPSQGESSPHQMVDGKQSRNAKKTKNHQATIADISPAVSGKSTEKDKKPGKRKKKSVMSRESSSPDESVSRVASAPVQQKGYNPPPGIVHEALLKQNKGSHKGSSVSHDTKDNSEEEDEICKKSRQKKTPRDKSKDSRTVFVGNLPISTDKKILKKLFRKFGQIENVRFRCPPPADLKLPKRAITIQKKFHPERSNIIGFVCFLEESSAQKALKMDAKLIDGCHIHVDLASSEKQHDHQRSIFVGNLPFDVSEEKVRDHFEDCGSVKNVRIIRDNKTGLGKGFCYVLFESKDSVHLAMKLNDSELQGRKLRILRSQENPTKSSTERHKTSDRNSNTGKFQGSDKKKGKGFRDFEGVRSNERKKKNKRFKKEKNTHTKMENMHNALKRLDWKNKGRKKKIIKR